MLPSSVTIRHLADIHAGDRFMLSQSLTRKAPRYADAAAAFSLEREAETLVGDLEHGINACVECCTRYAQGDATALLWISENQTFKTMTFAELDAQSAQFACVLQARGIRAGDVVAGMLPRIPELIVTILGTLRIGAIYQPLFTAFGPKAIEYRLDRSQAKLLVTDTGNEHKLDTVDACPPTLIVNTQTHGKALPCDFRDALNQHEPVFEPVMRKGDDGMLLLFTSGTTGNAKGVPVPLKALLSFRTYMQQAVDLRKQDVFWNVADPGWAYGLYYGILGPFVLGHATTFYQGSFSPESTCAIITRHHVTNLTGSPTAFRMLMAADPALFPPLKGQLRAVSSAGEPLNPEVIRWFDKELGVTVLDHYGQTETGMVLCNHHALEHNIHLGSAGLPLPGYRLAILDAENQPVEVGAQGTLAVDTDHSPICWFSGYLGTPLGQRYHITGDTVEEREDGTISFVGRNDDIITSSGYRIGPFDVESALLEHAAVQEAAVVGKPDPERTEIVQAFVVLSTGFTASDALIVELQQYVKTRLAAHSYPRSVVFIDALPKTPSGKIQRFLLRTAPP
jgi:acetyl-CoA synthetase